MSVFLLPGGEPAFGEDDRLTVTHDLAATSGLVHLPRAGLGVAVIPIVTGQTRGWAGPDQRTHAGRHVAKVRLSRSPMYPKPRQRWWREGIVDCRLSRSCLPG